MKNIYLPEFMPTQEKYIIKYETTPVAVIYLNILTVQGENRVCKKIAAFYSALLDRFSKWTKTDFEKYAQNEFISDQSPRKKFRYIPFELRFNMRSEILNNYYLKIDLNISLSKKRNMISEKNITHLWNLKNGTLHIQKRKKKAQTK